MHPLFVKAITNLDRIDYLISMVNGTTEEKILVQIKFLKTTKRQKMYRQHIKKIVSRCLSDIFYGLTLMLRKKYMIYLYAISMLWIYVYISSRIVRRKYIVRDHDK